MFRSCSFPSLYSVQPQYLHSSGTGNGHDPMRIIVRLRSRDSGTYTQRSKIAEGLSWCMFVLRVQIPEQPLIPMMTRFLKRSYPQLLQHVHMFPQHVHMFPQPLLSVLQRLHEIYCFLVLMTTTLWSRKHVLLMIQSRSLADPFF